MHKAVATDLVRCDQPRRMSLELMHQLCEARSEADNWTGTTDSAARRKKQNRLNQRAYRRRKAKPSKPIRDYSATPAPTELAPPDGRPNVFAYPTQALPSNASSIQYPQNSPAETTILVPHIPFPQPSPEDPTNHSLPSNALAFVPFSFGPPPRPRTAAPLQPAPSFLFPLPADHLLTLIQFNVYRALLTNIALLKLTSYFFPPTAASPSPYTHIPSNPTCAQPCNSRDPTLYPLNPPSTTLIPPALHPTDLQRTVPHARWIDIFPHPRIRDNLIRAGDRVSSDELCADLVGSICEEWDERDAAPVSWKEDGGDGVRQGNGGCGVLVEEEGEEEEERRGVIVWSDPWEMGGWELTEGFLRKWGWMLEGAEEVIELSNRWRERRGEERLFVEVV